ncbi:sugar transporter [Penicillium atrosanguineum]|uniref:sugar transporter n=1 Tax=Penicillium atrosanguineum TaxID=1132637 RepID=UPI0023A61396|nr:sugar transporter [Penicillium atrosanguineum]KAJ5300463.1 sugar transporter [Penicillium atrosanguineum]
MNSSNVLGDSTPDTNTSVPSSHTGPLWLSSMSSMSPPPPENIYGQNVFYPPMPANRSWENPSASPRSTARLADPAVHKVAIPRLAAPTGIRGRRRSARACEACRTRKTKCDGARPTCGQCAYHKNRCAYEDVKRVRDQKMLDVLARRVDRYETLLRSLEGESDPATTRRIRKALMAKDDKSSKNNVDDSDSDSSIGSLEDVDLVDEDINRNENTRAAGYFGKNSEIAWMQRLEDGIENDSRQQSIATSRSESTSETTSRPQENVVRDTPIAVMNYHLDDLDIPIAKDVDPFLVPPREVADEYLNAYMAFVHPIFSAVRKPAFISQYRQFFDRSAKPPRKWLGILNMIFAIGCRYSKLTGFTNAPHGNDLIFLSRAWKLGIQSNVLLEHTDLQQIQLEFLVAVYLLCLGQVNRASKFSGLALRSALSLGINLRLTDDRTHNASKEARCRLWWSIYSLEHLLTSMHGRASGVGESLCSVPAPIPIEEEYFEQPDVQRLFHDHQAREAQLRATLFDTQNNHSSQPNSSTWISQCVPSSSLFFYYLVDLALISQSVLNKVYSIEGVREGTSQTEYRLQKFSTLMDRWLAKLPSNYQFTIPSSGPWHLNHPKLDDTSAPYVRECICLAMSYYSSRITLCRPCLSHTQSHNSSESGSNLRSDMATQCLQAACALISILPESQDISWLARVTPWWSILHFLMQATTALLLGLSSASVSHSSASASSLSIPLNGQDLAAVIVETRKVFFWIHAMAAVDPAARRAFLLIEGVMRRIAGPLNLDLKEWPSSKSLATFGADGAARMEGLDELVDFEGTGSFGDAE